MNITLKKKLDSWGIQELKDDAYLLTDILNKADREIIKKLIDYIDDLEEKICELSKEK